MNAPGVFTGPRTDMPLFWCPCKAINVSVQYNGGFLPDIILLTLCYYHHGTRLNAMKSFCPCSQCSHLNALTIFPPDWVDALLIEGLDAFRFSFHHHLEEDGGIACCSSSWWNKGRGQRGRPREKGKRESGTCLMVLPLVIWGPPPQPPEKNEIQNLLAVVYQYIRKSVEYDIYTVLLYCSILRNAGIPDVPMGLTADCRSACIRHYP